MSMLKLVPANLVRYHSKNANLNILPAKITCYTVLNHYCTCIQKDKVISHVISQVRQTYSLKGCIYLLDPCISLQVTDIAVPEQQPAAACARVDHTYTSPVTTPYKPASPWSSPTLTPPSCSPVTPRGAYAIAKKQRTRVIISYQKKVNVWAPVELVQKDDRILNPGYKVCRPA